MSQYLATLYVKNYRKRPGNEQPGTQPKQPRTDAERARSYRERMKAAKGKASTTSGWDAGEGPSTRGT